MHQFELTDLEARTLRSALETSRRELRNEVIHTDDRTYKHKLQSNLTRLNQLIAKLDSFVPANDPLPLEHVG